MKEMWDALFVCFMGATIVGLFLIAKGCIVHEDEVQLQKYMACLITVEDPQTCK